MIAKSYRFFKYVFWETVNLLNTDKTIQKDSGIFSV
jgi:hypothetical protein